MNWKVMIAGLLLCIPLIFVLARGFNFDPNSLPEELTGEQAPDFSLPSLEGYQIALKETKGSPVVINFWATWCQPCLLEHGHLQNAANEYKAKGVTFLGVLYGDTPEKAKQFLKSKNFFCCSYEQLHTFLPYTSTTIYYQIYTISILRPIR